MMVEYICSFEEEYGFLVSASMKYGEELIRCGECEYCGNPLMCPLYRISPPSNGYCYCAERREGMATTDDVNNRFTDKDAYFAEVVLNVIRDIDTPMLMYEGEKEAVKKALIMALDEWEKRKKE